MIPAPRSAPISAASPRRSTAAAAPVRREPRREPPEPSYEYSRGPRYRSARRHPSPTAQTKAAASRSAGRPQDAPQLTLTLVSQFVQGYLARTKIAAAEVPDLIATIHHSLADLGKRQEGPPAEPAVAIRR